MSSIRRALISVSDKTGVAEFARDLAEAGVEILSPHYRQLRRDEAGATTVNLANSYLNPVIVAQAPRRSSKIERTGCAGPKTLLTLAITSW